MLVRFITNITSKSLLLHALTLSVFLFTPYAHAKKFPADEVKAVFMLNFAHYIRWPNDTFSNTVTPFHFCALSDQTPIIQSLIQVIHGESRQGRPLAFKLLNPLGSLNIDLIKACQILFFHEQELGQFFTLLPILQKSHILTISDTDNFIENGGMITLIHSEQRLRPMIHNNRLQQVGLKASSKLLQLAKIAK